MSLSQRCFIQQLTTYQHRPETLQFMKLLRFLKRIKLEQNSAKDGVLGDCPIKYKLPDCPIISYLMGHVANKIVPCILEIHIQLYYDTVYLSNENP